jgi:Fur family transcriptional regulator, stress-responsive regulator
VGLLLRRIEPSRSPARYETRVGDNDHQVVCCACGAIPDIDRVIGEPPCLSSSANGFVIDEAEVSFWGRCPGRQTKSESHEKENAR